MWIEILKKIGAAIFRENFRNENTSGWSGFDRQIAVRCPGKVQSEYPVSASGDFQFLRYFGHTLFSSFQKKREAFSL